MQNQDEIEQLLEQVLFKMQPHLDADELSIIRWACGKSNQSKENHETFDFNDI